MSNEPERLLVSAIQYPWGEVETGLRHADVIKAMAARRLPSQEGVQGFATSHGRFVSRENAKEIAILSGQIDPDHKGEVHSEDLW